MYVPIVNIRDMARSDGECEDTAQDLRAITNSVTVQEKKVVGKKRITDGKKVKEEKRRKWEAKQSSQKQRKTKEEERDAWMRENSHFCSHVTKEDIEGIKLHSNSESTLRRFLLPYFDIQDGRPQSSDASERLFIAEGTETIRLLIQQSINPNLPSLSPIKIKSVFVKPSILFEAPVAMKKSILLAANENAKTEKVKNHGKAAPPFQLFVGSESVISDIAGFSVSRGALSCGVVPTYRDEVWLNAFLQRRFHEKNSALRLLALDGICDTANLGSIVRCASAFGVDSIILSEDSCDVWYRRSVRVSMGHVFRVPVVRVADLAATIRSHNAAFALTSYAAVIDLDAEIVLEKLEHASVPRAWCCVMGNESRGISAPVVESCTKRIRIAMESGVDSLSVPIATGILIHGLKTKER